MAGFEQGFADTERAATLTAKSAGDVARAAKALERGDGGVSGRASQQMPGRSADYTTGSGN